MVTNAITPAFADQSADQALLRALPEKLRAPYAYLLEKSLKAPEVATFCTYLFSAVMGNQDALRRVLEISFAAHFLRHRARSAEQIAVTNAIVYCANVLSEIVLRAEEPQPEPKPEAVPANPEAPKSTAKPDAPKPAPKQIQKSTPVKKAEQRKKPAHTFSRKPGLLISER